MRQLSLQEVKLTGTTDASGDLTVTATRALIGVIYGVQWVDGTFDDGVDAVLSATNTISGVDNTLLTLTNANDDDWYYPNEQICDNTGSALAGYQPSLVNGVLQLVVSSGGNAKTGGAVVYVLT